VSFLLLFQKGRKEAIMAGGIINVSRSEPCPICGKPDWCFSRQMGDGIGRYCHRVDDDVVVGAGGTYLLQRITESGFAFYESAEDKQAAKERWIDEQIKNGNPKFKNYWDRHKRGDVDLVSLASKAEKVRTSAPKGYVAEKVSEAADPDRLDEVYYWFLTHLVLEEHDRKYLEGEWNNPQYPELMLADRLLERWLIRSLPMSDYDRSMGGWNLRNSKRRALLDQMVREIGEPENVPGFFISSYDGKWDYTLSGIAFPSATSVPSKIHEGGQITRIRIRDEHPMVTGEYNGQEGTYSFFKGGWQFRPAAGEGDEKPKMITVYNPKQGIRLVDVGFGMPKGKVMGKYKNFSSYKEVTDEESHTIKNKYEAGTRSGSPISLYVKEGDRYGAVYVVEGEKKAIITNEAYSAPCIAVPGVGTFAKLLEKEEGSEKSILDNLKDKGMKFLVLAYDADKEKNPAVLKAEAGAIRTITESGVKMMLAEWNMALGKGMDDLIMQKGAPTFKPVKLKS